MEYHPIIISLAINNAEHFKAKLISELDLNKKMLSFRLFDLQVALFFFTVFFMRSFAYLEPLFVDLQDIVKFGDRGLLDFLPHSFVFSK